MASQSSAASVASSAGPGRRKRRKITDEQIAEEAKALTQSFAGNTACQNWSHKHQLTMDSMHFRAGLPEFYGIQVVSVPIASSEAGVLYATPDPQDLASVASCAMLSDHIDVQNMLPEVGVLLHKLEAYMLPKVYMYMRVQWYDFQDPRCQALIASVLKRAHVFMEHLSDRLTNTQSFCAILAFCGAAISGALSRWAGVRACLAINAQPVCV